MKKCEICGKLPTDKHHIVYKSEGGVDFPLNFKYLCPIHHRGIDGPHKNRHLDLLYKLELQEKLYNLLPNEYYDLKELSPLIEINEGLLKIMFKSIKSHNNMYKKEKIIYRLMGNKNY